ncbi:hypothetical protein PO002_31045 [Cupriavidus necator]|uniref:hypothetical protein n=1 Tax=Cupriavidus necator TaxID=106590 RepID=UPI0039C3681F
MEDSWQVSEPIAVARPYGAHRLEAFSPKLNRRIVLYRRQAFDLWITIESDPKVREFCERPGYIQFRGKRGLADFLVTYPDRQELVILPDPIVGGDAKPLANLDAGDRNVRLVHAAELAASRIWVDNWQRMLPCIVATRGLLPASLLRLVKDFVATPQPLFAIERELSKSDSILVRAAVFQLLHEGRVTAPELRTDTLSLSTRFSAVEAQS